MAKPIQKPTQKVIELVEQMRSAFGLLDHGNDDQTEYRYVIYARRSTKKFDKQIRCIEDQITECKALADHLGLRWLKVIAEEKSAKISDKRPLFRAMIDDLKAGKYEGIITWAPDRLARNMKEGGEIIDLLDHFDIKDIKFANHFSFQNDSSGKILFVIFLKQKTSVYTNEFKISESIIKIFFWRKRNRNRILGIFQNFPLLTLIQKLRTTQFSKVEMILWMARFLCCDIGVFFEYRLLNQNNIFHLPNFLKYTQSTYKIIINKKSLFWNSNL